MDSDDQSNVFEMDGSVLEGGGQILRMAVSLSSLLFKPRQALRIKNIRAGRSKPGLKAQHMCGINLVSSMTQGDLVGCAINSSEITFTPRPTNKTDIDHQQQSTVHFTMDTQTAGATTLLAQVALPVALFRPHQTILHLKGGTNADMAPQVDYYASVFKKLLEAFGASFECEVKRRGYFPRGGGHIDLTLSPLSKPLTAIEIVDPGQLSVISIKASAAGKVASSVAQQMASSARAELLKNIPTGVNISVNTDYFDHNQATGSGNSIMIIAETTTGCILGGSAIGSPKKKPETVGLSAAKELLGSLQRRVCLDEYAQDQVIIFMALAKGHSKVLTGPLTLHTKTAIHVAELMTRSKFNVTENSSNGNCLIECDGIGHYH